MASLLQLQSACLRHLRQTCFCQHSVLSYRGFRSIANHYEVLGIDKDATTSEIRSAFLAKSKEYHPDMGTRKGNHKKFVEVNEAYTVLSKPVSRREYDLKLIVRANSMHPRTSAHTRHPDSHYEHPNHFYDPQIYSMRDRSQDTYYKGQPYYGMKGVKKITNIQIVVGCFLFMLTGIVIHSVVVKRSSDLHMRNLDARDAKIHSMWRDAVNTASSQSKEERYESLKDYQETRKWKQLQK